MRQMGLSFRVMVSSVDEPLDSCAEPRSLACSLALRKAEDIARGLIHPGLVIGADTIVFKDRIFGKPQDEEDAVRMLLSLQGGEHEVITGLALVDSFSGYRDTACECTAVEMAPLAEGQIRSYIATGESKGKAGAYGIQGRAAVFIPSIRALLIDSGSHQNYELIHDSHENADKHVTGMIDAAMFNLGYMPGGDHSITTNAVSTLSAIKVCMGLLKPLGIITICVYYGHTEGLEEKKQLIDFLVNVDNKAFAVSKLDFLNQPNAPPQLIFIQKNK
jgi:septum formation protein